MPYWIWIAVLIAAKLAIVMVAQSSPDGGGLSNIDTGVAIGVAYVVGARFADAGWPRWIGGLLVILIMFVLPVIILVATPGALNGGGNVYNNMPASMWVTTAALLVVLVVAGVRPSVVTADPPTSAPTPAH